jgi:iron(III) transport system ATP-binding protein
MRVMVAEVTKSFGDTAVLKGCSLVVEEGQLVAVLGPSGCGKTTLLRIVAGFERTDGGSVTIGDRVVTALPPERRGVGIVPQEAALFPHLTVARNVGFGLPRGSRDRIAECLELVGLAGFGGRMPHELSGGQQQRVALARALAPKPGVVLLDEPFNALDRSLRASVRDDVRAALERAGATAVLVTHDQEEALSMADVVAVMREGRIVQEGTPSSVYAAPHDLGVATFVGEAVVLKARSADGLASCTLGDLPHRPDGADGPGHVAVRPEQFELSERDTGVSGRIERVEFFGHDAAITVRLDSGTTIRARTRGDVPYRPGNRIGVAVKGQVLFYPD